MTAAPHSSGFIAAAGLTKWFGAVRALNGISFEIPKGSICALLGENGAGKSTLIGLLMGIHQADAGTVLIDGTPQTLTSPRDALERGVVAVLQRSHLVPELSIRDNFRLAQAPLPIDRELAEATLTQLAEAQFDLDSRVGDYDLGTRALIEIARAVARRPQLLILDEPTAQLDAGSASRLLGLLGALRDAGTSVLFVTHKLPEVLSSADTFTVLRRGELVLARTRSELVRDGEAAAEAALLNAMFGADHRLTEHAVRQNSAAPSLAPDEQPTLLELEQVSTISEVGQRGLHEVSFSVRAGEILAIAGILGNGQAHLAQVLEGSRIPTAGSVRMLGREITGMSIRDRRALGMRLLTDDRFGNGLVPQLSVALNLVLDRIGSQPFWRRGITRTGVLYEHARKTVSRAGIVAPDVDAPAGTLSGGNAQKLLLARDSDMPTQVYVCNQPTYGLDVATVHDVHDGIRARAERDEAVVLISADLDEVVKLADRVLVLEAGRVVATVPGHETRTRSELNRALAGVKR